VTAQRRALQPGLSKLRYKGFAPSAGGRDWVSMRDPDCVARLHDADWERACGDLGALRVGDGLCCL